MLGELMPRPDGPDCEVVANLPELHGEEMRPLVELLEDASVKKVGQNLKYDFLVFRREGIDLRGIDFDTMVASYVLEPGRREHGMDSLALQHLDHRTDRLRRGGGEGKGAVPFAEVAAGRGRDYAAEDADIALRLAEKFAPEMESLHLEPLFRDIEMPLVHVLAEMEWNGIRIDEPFFARMGEELRSQLRTVEQRSTRGGGGVQHQQHAAAAGDPVRQAGAARHQEDQDGRVNGRGRARRSWRRRGIAPHAADAVPAARQAARHLRRHAAAAR